MEFIKVAMQKYKEGDEAFDEEELTMMMYIENLESLTGIWVC